MADIERPMTVVELAVGICDDFHDWIDGDDWVVEEKVDHLPNSSIVTAKFASGKTFVVHVREVVQQGEHVDA